MIFLCRICGIDIHVEIPLFLVYFSQAITVPIYTNFVIYRSCYVILGFNETDCAKLGTKYADNNTAHLETLVQPTAAVINMVKTFAESFFTALMCAFFGPWSDKFGRKPLMMISLIGLTICYSGLAIMSSTSNLSPWFTILCSIPVMLSGGMPSFVTAVLSYLTDITDESMRGIRMGLFEVFLFCGFLLGNILSSYIFEAIGYELLFAMAAACCLIGGIITISIKESMLHRETSGYVRKFFKTDNIRDLLQISFKNRGEFKRSIILGILFMLTLYTFLTVGDGAVIFYYLRQNFEWSLEQFTLFSAFSNVAWIAGTIFGVGVLNKLLGWTETFLILLGFLFMFTGVLLLGLGTNNYYVYAVGFIRCFGGIIAPMARCLLSKLVKYDEVGKIFAVILIIEYMLGVFGAPAFVEIYNTTINTHPGAFNFVAAALYGLNIVIILAILLVQRKERREYITVNLNDCNRKEEIDCPNENIA